jgi:hypothetical protein
MKKPKQISKTDTPVPATRRWLVRLFRITVAMVVVLIILRAALLAGLPGLLDRTLTARGLAGSYDRLRLHLLTGDAELWHLDIRPSDKEESLAHLEYCRIHVSIWTLLRGELVIPRLEVDGLDMSLHRDVNGIWTGWDRLVQLSSMSGTQETPDPRKQERPAQISNLKPPFKLDALRLQNVQVALTDQAVSPAVETLLDFNLSLSNLDSARWPTRFQLTLSMRDILEHLSLSGKARGNDIHVSGSFRGTLQGLYPAPIRTYLEHIGIASWAKRLDGGFQGEVDVEVVEDASNASISKLALEAKIEKLRLAADASNEMSLEHLALSAEFSTESGIEVHSLQASSGNVRVYRDPQAGISLGGIYLKRPHSSASPPPQAKRPPPKQSSPTESLSPAEPGLSWSIGSVDLQDVHLIWDERCVPDVSPLDLHVMSGSVGPIRLPEDAARPIDIRLQASLPGVFTSAELSGQCILFSPGKQVDIRLSLDGLAPRAVSGYLTLAGLVAEHESASLTGRVRWSLHPATSNRPAQHSALLEDVSMEDRGQTLAVWKQIAVEDIAWNDHRRRLSMGRIDVQGEQTTLRWDRTGQLHALGLTRAPSNEEHEAASEVNAPEGMEETPSSPPAGFVCKEITIDVGEVHLIDESNVAGGPVIRTVSLTGRVDNVLLDPRAEGENSSGQLMVHMGIPGLVEALTLNGTLQAKPPATLFDLSIQGIGLQPRNAATYFKSWGIVPNMGVSELQVKCSGQWMPEAEGLALSLSFDEALLCDADRTYLRLSDLHLDAFRLDKNVIQVGVLDINEPLVAIQRDPNGVKSFAGLTFLPRSESEPEPTPRDTPMGLCVGQFALRGARVDLQDLQVNPVVETALDFDVEIRDVNTLTRDEPATIQARWHLPGVMELATLDLRMQGDQDAVTVTGGLQVSGWHPWLITRYLPEGSTSLVERGRMAVQGTASMTRRPEGGHRWDLRIGEFDYREMGDPVPWLHADNATLVAHVEGASDTGILVEQITVDGIEGHLAKGAEGRLHVLGFALGASPGESPPVPSDTVREAAPEPRAASSRPTGKPLPDITVQQVLLGIRKLDYQDFTRADTPSLALEDFQLVNTAPLELMGETAAAKPPMALQLEGRLPPLTESFTIKTLTAPLASSPSLDLDVDITGIEGTEILAWAPSWAERIDSTALTQGRLTGRLNLETTFARRRVTEFDFNRAFGVTLSARSVHLTNGDPNNILAGIDGLQIEAPSIDIPRRRFEIASIDMVRPHCQLATEPNGFRVLDLVFKKQNAVARPDPATPLTAASDSPPADYRVSLGQFLISGLDLVYRDSTVQPHFNLPLNGLDLDVRNVTAPWSVASGPVRLNAMMTSGEITLKGKTGATDQRPLFHEFVLTGYILPGDNPEGWIKAGLKDLDLRSLQGLAGRQGVQIHNGVLDTKVDVRILPTGKAPVQIQVVLDDLSLTESDEGFLQKALSLSMPVDIAVHMLEGVDGSLRLSLPLTLDRNGVSAAQIRNAVVGTATVVIGRAIATSPVKIVTGAGRLATQTGRFLTGTSKKQASRPQDLAPIVIDYAPGAIMLDEHQMAQLEQAGTLMRKNRHLNVTVRHQLGTQDILAVERLANPSSEDREALLAQLRYMRSQADRQRADLAAQTEAIYAASDLIRSRTLSGELMQLDEHLGMLNGAIDYVLEMMGPNIAHHTRRRTRQGALGLARARLLTVRDTLLQNGIQKIETRLKITQPSFLVPEGEQPSQITLTLGE